jgi:hypothetical protein
MMHTDSKGASEYPKLIGHHPEFHFNTDVNLTNVEITIVIINNILICTPKNWDKILGGGGVGIITNNKISQRQATQNISGWLATRGRDSNVKELTKMVNYGLYNIQSISLVVA